MKCPLLWMGIKGLSLTKEEKAGIQKYGVSGLILFKRNIESLSQLLELCQEIKSLTPAPLIMMDREGGEVDRLSHLPDFPSWPSPAWLSGHCSLKQIQQTAYHIACEMRALGIGLNFAPVVDIPFVDSTLLKSRMWVDYPEQVSQRALTWIKGFSQAGVASCVKHFPGHGGVKEDSHYTLPKDTRDLSLLEEHDLVPFQQAIEAGVDLVMTAHVAYMAIEVSATYGGSNQLDTISPLPATFSARLLQDVLRESMGFQGLVVSDDLDMEALSYKGLLETDIMKKALLAGVDILLKCEPPKDTLAFLEKTHSVFTKREVKEVKEQKISRLQKFQQKYLSIQPVETLKEIELVLTKTRKWCDSLIKKRVKACF